jgi:GT2 family glycosyltransferase
MIIICVALDKELPLSFKKKYPHQWVRFSALKSGAWSQYKTAPLLVVVTGVGHNALTALDWLIKRQTITFVVNIGTAGGPIHHHQKWVQLTQTTGPHGTYDCAPLVALPIPYESFPKCTGTSVSAPQPSRHPATHIIDMEANYLAHACQNSNIPFSSFKYITDDNTARFNEQFNDHFNHYLHNADQLFGTLHLPPPRISVIMPIFQRSAMGKRAIASVMNQTHAPHEVIIVDDGSTPPQPHPIPGANVIRLNKNQGVSHARNIGIQQATGDWVALIDSDDVWHPHHLSAITSAIQSDPLTRLWQTQETWIRNGQHLNQKKYHQKPQGWAFIPSLDRCLVSPSAVAIHTSLFDRFGEFNESLTVCEDYDLWLRLLAYCPLGHIDTISMTKYGGHPDQLSMAYVAMDRFRLVALIHAYHSLMDHPWHENIVQTIMNKTTILSHGAKKRGQNTTNYAKIQTHVRERTLIPQGLCETLLDHVPRRDH